MSLVHVITIWLVPVTFGELSMTDIRLLQCRHEAKLPFMSGTGPFPVATARSLEAVSADAESEMSDMSQRCHPLTWTTEAPGLSSTDMDSRGPRTVIH
jgi:hypothetical protein